MKGDAEKNVGVGGTHKLSLAIFSKPTPLDPNFNFSTPACVPLAPLPLALRVSALPRHCHSGNLKRTKLFPKGG